MIYKYSFSCSFHSFIDIFPLLKLFFILPYLFTTEKTKTTIDYLDNRTNQQASRSSKGLFLVSMEHRRGRSSPNATPLAILGFSFIHTFHSLGGHLSMILLTTRGKIRRNPTSSLPPIICHHHLKPNTAQLMERQSTATMHIPLHYTIQCI